MLLGVCGGIACYKAAEVARVLSKAGASVQVVMTEAATRFVGTVTFAALTRTPVFTGIFEREETVLHVRLARDADLLLVVPATANVLAKLAHGIADDLLTSVALTATCPIVVAPAMHTEMWDHEATRANVEILRARGVSLVGPDEGELAAGDEGIGRLADAAEIVAAAAAALEHGHDLAGVRMIVTAGGTQEPIDPVRFLTNRSSGKMGYAIAAEAARRGAAVTLISGPTKLSPPERTEIVHVQTVLEMRDAVLAHYENSDVVVKAAAVADFRPANPSERKIKKSDSGPVIELVLNPDILAELGANKQHQILVGFAAETEDHRAGARKKLAEKNLDLIVLNPVGVPDSGFDVDTNRVTIIGADGTEEELPLQPKSQVARALCERIVAVLRARGRA